MLNSFSWRTIARVIVFVVLCLLLAPSISMAREGGMIRDAETEDMLRRYSVPLIKAASLSTEQVKVLIVNQRSVNAFVAGGQNIFLNTGLMLEAKKPELLIGVIAHELGHIAGGHLSRAEPELRKSKIYQTMAWILGLGSILAGAGADVGSAVLLGGHQVGQRGYLKFTRTQEASADEAALVLLERTKQSPAGLVGMLEILNQRVKYYRALTGAALDPYMLTHPLPQSRIDALQEALKNSPYRDKQTPAEQQHRHDMVRAKLLGFLEKPAITFKVYTRDNQSTPALYARAIAYFKSKNLDQALELIDRVIKREPQNAWAYELKGQMLYESGFAERAIRPYQISTQIKPHESLLYVGLGTAQKQSEDLEIVAQGVASLEKSLKLEKNNPTALFQLGNAYDRLGKTGMAQLALAEYYAAINRMDYAMRQAERAQRVLKEGTPEWLRADDILVLARGPMPEGAMGKEGEKNRERDRERGAPPPRKRHNHAH